MIHADHLISSCFNPRVLAGGRDATAKSVGYARRCFNPRGLAGGRDIADLPPPEPVAVSIHAASREDATDDFDVSCYSILFQSTRTRGRTRRDWRFAVERMTGFNPRVLARGRDERTRR